MKILSAPQLQQWDAYSITKQHITSAALMERAAQCCTDKIVRMGLLDRSIKIFCGKGNNGGDGLAIARQLIALGADPSVYILEFGARGTDDFQTNLRLLHECTTHIYFMQSDAFLPVINKDDTIIDALFGSGLNRPLEQLSAEAVNHINASGALVISIDVPSGMYLDRSSVGNSVVKASYTFTFQRLKLCFLIPENEPFIGEPSILEIGLDEDFAAQANTVFELTTMKRVSSLFRMRKQFSHKGSYGHALLVAGNTGKMGACILASRSCLRSGVGLLTCAVQEAGLNIVQTAVPEAMAVIRDGQTAHLDCSAYSAIGIGPGLGKEDASVKLAGQVITEFRKPLVIDADAINILGMHPEWLSLLAEGTVLTPHPKEFERVFGKAENDFDRVGKAIEATKKYPVVLVLKGHYTLVAFQGKGYFNTTGNAGMATGGSGDVLTGIITSLLAQQYKPEEAAVLGVYLHGLAGDLCLADQSMESMLPSDLTDHLGKAFYQIQDNKKEVQE